MKEKHAFMPLYATDFLWSGDPDCTALYRFYSSGSGKAFKPDIRHCRSLLDTAADSSSAVECWWQQWCNGHRCHQCVLFANRIRVVVGFFFMKRHSDNSSFCPTKKKLHLCAVSLANSPAEFKLNAAAPVDKRRLATTPYIL